MGGIAPGRFADLLLLDDLEQCHVDKVWVGGKLVAQQGVSLWKGTPIPVPPELVHCLNIRAEISAKTFKIISPATTAKIRVMELVNQTITAEQIVELDTQSGLVEANVYDDLLKVAMFDRHGDSNVAFGFLKGFGAKVGAVASTVNIDENTLLVVGSNDVDMALCVNTLIDCGGGIAIADQEQVLEKFECSVGGIFSLYPWQEVGQGLKRIQGFLRDHGSPFERPMFALSFLPFVALPALRITARGLVNAKERKIVPLFVDEGRL